MLNQANQNKLVRRGEVYWSELPGGVGSEQRGIRPVLCVGNSIGLKNGPIALVAPLSSKNKRRLPTHIYLSKGENNLESDSTILLEQICVIDKSRLKGYVTYLDESMMRKVDACIAISFGLAEPERRTTK
jgi:mRNA interferase MazF